MHLTALLAAITAITGNTWNPAKKGIKKLTPIGWVALVAALATAVFSSRKTLLDNAANEQLRAQFSKTAADALFHLNQEISDRGGSRRLTPTVALFAATASKRSDITGDPSDSSYYQLARHILGDTAEIEGIELKADFFSTKLTSQLTLTKSANSLKPKEGDIGMAFTTTINNPPNDLLSFSLLLQTDEEFETATLVRDIVDKKGTIDIAIKIKPKVQDRHLISHTEGKQRRGFGYFYLSDKPVARLLFDLEPSEPRIEKMRDGRYLLLQWKIGAVEGIKPAGEQRR